MKIIIDWERREVYKEEEFSDLIDSMVDYGEIVSFESYLSDDYYIDEVFNFTESKKAEVRAEYEKYQKHEVKRITESSSEYTVIEINSENKVNIN